MPQIKPAIKSKIVLKGIPGGVVYHYTTLRCFKKIIETQCFLMTHYKDFTDDKEEVVWALDYYRKIISNLFSPSIDFSELHPEDFFVLSTCIRPNNLYLWQEYASLKKGDLDGVVIGVNATNLYEHYCINKNQIHMSPMEYEREKFMVKCQESISGLPPIALKAPLNLRPDQIDRDNPQNTLKLIPGYNQYHQKRAGPLGEAFLQKAPQYILEEEVRIVHYPKEVHERSLRTLRVKSKAKAVLPLVVNGSHLIEEIIISHHCKMNKRQIAGILRQSGIYTPVKIIDDSELR